MNQASRKAAVGAEAAIVGGDQRPLSWGDAWNRFWFAPSDPATVCLLRVLVGGAALYYLLSFRWNLVSWFGADGLLPPPLVRELTDGFHWSYLNFVETPGLLWGLHVGGMLVVLALTVGCCTRVSALLSLIIILSYIHRAPMLAGQFEAVLSMLLLYLCLAPCDREYSLDAWYRRRRGVAGAAQSVAATIAIRLMQLHLAWFYLVFGLSKLAGATWWAGDAVWWLIARSESRLADLTGLYNATYLINFWTHAIVMYELAFAILIWRPAVRPLLLAISPVMWGSLALITGQVSFCLIMLVANLCFVPPAATRRFLSLLTGHTRDNL